MIKSDRVDTSRDSMDIPEITAGSVKDIIGYLSGIADPYLLIIIGLSLSWLVLGYLLMKRLTAKKPRRRKRAAYHPVTLPVDEEKAPLADEGERIHTPDDVGVCGRMSIASGHE